MSYKLVGEKIMFKFFCWVYLRFFGRSSAWRPAYSISPPYPSQPLPSTPLSPYPLPLSAPTLSSLSAPTLSPLGQCVQKTRYVLKLCAVVIFKSQFITKYSVLYICIYIVYNGLWLFWNKPTGVCRIVSIFLNLQNSYMGFVDVRCWMNYIEVNWYEIV